MVGSLTRHEQFDRIIAFLKSYNPVLMPGATFKNVQHFAKEALVDLDASDFDQLCTWSVIRKHYNIDIEKAHNYCQVNYSEDYTFDDLTIPGPQIYGLPS